MKKILIIVILVLLFVAAGAVPVWWFLKNENYYFDEKTFPVVLVSDIHMGSEQCEWDQCGPKVEEAFQYVLDQTGDALVITAGDNTDASAYSKDQVAASALRDGFKQKLLEMTAGRTVMWANGNHDRQTYVSGHEYYSYDKNNWRFIIIHTTDVQGEQFEWIKDQLKTDKNVIVVMHHPVFKQGKRNILSRYADLVKLFSEKKVKYVISGHWHSDRYERPIDGVIYKALQGLTYNYYLTNKVKYETIDLPYRMIDVESSPSKKGFLIWMHAQFEKLRP